MLVQTNQPTTPASVRGGSARRRQVVSGLYRSTGHARWMGTQKRTRHPMLRPAHPADSETEAYLNRPDVQQALHANVSGELPGPWQDCTSKISYSR